MGAKKGLSIASFIIVMLALIIAVITDIAIFSNVLKTFIAAIILSSVIFVILVAAFLVSFILIFGFYLVEKHGFWPLTVSMNAFKGILSDVEITASQLGAFKGARIGLLIACVIALIIAIVAKSIRLEDGKKPKNGLATTAMVFAILGLVVGTTMLVLTNAIG